MHQPVTTPAKAPPWPEDLLFERGVDISYETVRYRWNRLRQSYKERRSEAFSELGQSWARPAWVWVSCVLAETCRL